MADPAPSSFLQALRVLSAALMAGLVVLLVAVTAVLVSKGSGTPPIWSYPVVIVAFLAGAALIERFGYRFTPIAPGTPEDQARASSARQVQSTTILRFAFAEAVALVSVVLAFLVPHGGVYLPVLGVAFAELLMIANVWPKEKTLARIQEGLESEGGLSYLREALASPAPSRNG